MRADPRGSGFKAEKDDVKIRHRWRVGRSAVIPGNIRVCPGGPPVHRGDSPIHKWHKYQPTQDDLEKLDTQDITRKEAKQVNRLYNQLESTGGEPQSGVEVNEGGLDQFIEEENQRLDRVDNICRGC
jgi:hypothetical protein